MKMAALAVLALMGGAADPIIPRELECPAPLVRRAQQVLLDLHPDTTVGGEGEHCRRVDGALQAPTVAWGVGRWKLSMVGSYCDGHAQGRWSFFGRNGGILREGSFVG